MRQDASKDGNLIRYILGELPESESAQIEEEYLHDDESFQQLLALEEELAHQYVRGDLPKHDKKKWEERLLISPEARKKTDFAKALEQSITRNVVSSERIHLLPGLALRWIAAVFLIGTITSLFWQFVILGARLDDVSAKYALLEQKWKRQMARTQTSSDRPILQRFLLNAGSTRSEGSDARIRIASETDSAEIHMVLHRNSEYTKYKAALLDPDGAILWSQLLDESAWINSGSALRIVIPVKILQQNDYEITVSASRNGQFDAVAYYYFTVIGPS